MADDLGAFADLVPAGQSRAPADLGAFADLVPEKKPDMGRAAAFLTGAKSGVTFNWGDEISAAQQAALAGTPFEKFSTSVPGATLIGLARLGYEKLTGEPGAASEVFDKTVAKGREQMATAREQYPGTTLAGELTGAVAVPLPGAAALRGAGIGARTLAGAATGAGLGAVAGAGEGGTLAERGMGAAQGAGFGAVGGAAGPTILRGVQAVGQAAAPIVRPITSTVRGLVNPEAEAARRVTGALTRDMRQGTSELTPAQFTTARNAGAPVANLDLGGETTRAVARSAANTSPEARTTLQNLADARFEGQADRATTFINRLVGGVDTHAAREGLRVQAQAVNSPAYRQAYRRPAAQGMWDEGFEQISQAPVVQDAIRAASVTGANRGTIEGFPRIRSPFAVDRQTGQLALRVDDQGNRVLPNLEFWDHVKRNLDKINTPEARTLNTALKQHLDDLVPEYRTARAGAARFFGAEHAMEAGENFVRSNMTAAEGARAFAQMSQQERELFRQGFASRLIDDISNTRDRVNVLNKIGQSPEARRKLQVALGDQGYRWVEAFLTVEQAMDRLRGALGNSTTARQLIELGLAGGATGAATGDFSPQTLLTGAILYGTVKKGGQRIDERVARRVADMLTSNDPNVLARGIRMAASNRNLLESFRSLDQRLARIAGQQGPEFNAGAIGRADEQQQDVPRPPGQ